MQFKPIRNDNEYRAALQEIDRLFEAHPDTPEADRLEVWAIHVEAYERQLYPVSLPDPIEAIEYYLESRGLSRKDLEPYIGSRARVSEILNRRRPLTLRMIRNLESGLGIPAKVLVQPYELVQVSADETPSPNVFADWVDIHPSHTSRECVVTIVRLSRGLADSLMLEAESPEGSERSSLSRAIAQVMPERLVVGTASDVSSEDEGQTPLIRYSRIPRDPTILYLQDYVA